MTASFEKTGVNNGTLTFTIEQDLIAKGLDAAFNKVKKNLNVPGFRKGKVSRTIFNKMYGEASLYEEALNAVLPESYDAAVLEAGIEPVAQPKIDIKSMNEGEAWEITADVVVKPEVKLGDYKNLEVSVTVDKDVTDADVDAKIEAAQKNLAELVIKEAAAENGDTVVIDFEGKVDGVAFDGGTAENHSLELGSASFIPGYEEQLVGHKAGETIEVKVTFPEDYQAEDLAGKDAVFVTTIHEVKAKEVPEIDDELAKDIDEEVETLAELKAKYKTQLTEEKETQYTDAFETAAIETAVANAEIVELPGEMVHDEVHRAMNEFLGNMQQQGISADMYYQLTGTSEEQLHTQFEGDADKRVRTNLVIEAVAAAENFVTTQDEIDTEISELSETYNMPKEEVMKLLPTDMLKHDIAAKKAVEVITSTAVVK
ncbi:trigger factor [Lactococcus piscium]|uniref:trigger factor n=1 Tax=Pseudolactococcus carnosus TaxID=2749961 RepID=UPI001FBB1447|nr:trigger factor [Lactococcus carnosus]MCJ1981980.1 trigger factor [Lactococcus carnosus]